MSTASLDRLTVLGAGVLGGLTIRAGYYTYPNPAYQAADFLDVPDISRATELGLQARLS